MLEHELDLLKIDVDSMKNKVDYLFNRFCEVTSSDWFRYLESKNTRFLNGIKDRCMIIIAKEKPKVSTSERFRGGPSVFTYKNLQLYVTVCGLNDDIANYFAVYDGGDLPEKLAKELFEFATAMYKEKGNKNDN